MKTWVEILRLFSQSLWSIARLRISPSEVLRQYFEAGVRSILFVSVTMAFIGMLGVYQTASQMAKVLPEFSVLGAGVIQMGIRELAPVMTGLLLSIRVGTGYAAEIGTMKVTDQLEAMKLSNVDPVEWLVVPRLLASTGAGLSLGVVGAVVGIGTGMVVAYTGFSVLPDTYLSLRFVRMHDLTMGITKCVAMGFAIPLVSCACGFEAEGGSEGVGRATTKAVVMSSMVVILIDAFISVFWEVAL